MEDMTRRARIATPLTPLVLSVLALAVTPPRPGRTACPCWASTPARSRLLARTWPTTRRAETGTALEAIDADSERRLRRVILPGRLSMPAVAYDATPSGLSADGRALVLINPRRGFPRSDTSFAFVDTRTLTIRRRLTLEGDLSFDALSPDARTMYLIRYLSPRDVTRYEVRAYDMRRGRLLEKPIVDPREPAERMSGMPIPRATGPGARWEYTLYEGPEYAFIHALDTERREAFCIDLEGIANGPQGVLGARLVLDGGTLAVVAGRRRLASVDTSTLRAKIARRPKSGEKGRQRPERPRPGLRRALAADPGPDAPPGRRAGAPETPLESGRRRQLGLSLQRLGVGGLRDAPGGAVEGPAGEQRRGSVGHQPSPYAPSATHGHRGAHVRPLVGGKELIAHVEADRSVRRQLEALLAGRVDLYVEADRHTGQPAGHADASTGVESSVVRIVELEFDRRPAPDLLRIREHVEQLLGSRVRGCCRGPCGHGGHDASASGSDLSDGAHCRYEHR
jgi:hypothetical protein